MNQLPDFKIKPIREIFDFRGFGNYALFAIAFGMALASKINAIIIVVLLPLGIILNDPDILKSNIITSLEKTYSSFSFYRTD